MSSLTEPLAQARLALKDARPAMFGDGLGQGRVDAAFLALDRIEQRAADMEPTATPDAAVAQLVTAARAVVVTEFVQNAHPADNAEIRRRAEEFRAALARFPEEQT